MWNEKHSNPEEAKDSESMSTKLKYIFSEINAVLENHFNKVICCFDECDTESQKLILNSLIKLKNQLDEKLNHPYLVEQDRENTSNVSTPLCSFGSDC